MTPLNKRLERQIDLEGKAWIVSLLPADEVNRFDRIAFRPKGCRRGGPAEYWQTLDGAMMTAALRTAEAKRKERQAARKAAKFGN